MAKRKIRDHVDARECLAAQAASKLTLAEWACQAGVDARSLNLWRVNLARRTPRYSPREVKLVELIPASSAPVARYTIRCRDLSLEVPGDFEPDTLLRLLRVVAAC